MRARPPVWLLLLAIGSGGCGLLIEADFPLLSGAARRDVPGEDDAVDDPVDAPPDAPADAGVDVPSDLPPGDAAMDASPDAAADVALDVAPDRAADAPSDVPADRPLDVPIDVVRDAETLPDVAREAGADVIAVDVRDAPPDLGVDVTAVDVRDATPDLGVDAGPPRCTTTRPCPTGFSCNVVDSCAADTPGECVPTESTCPIDFLPNCGCDGRTYSSECARTNANVARRAMGPCPASDAGSGCGVVGCRAGLSCCAATGTCYDPRCLACCMAGIGVDAGP